MIQGGTLRETMGRTPHGVRGLKSHHLDGCIQISRVAPLTGCVD